MPSVGDTQLLTVYIKTFNAQFLKQKQPQNSRQHCCSFCEKGHSAGTKSTSISLIVAISENNILFSNATSSHIPDFSSLILGLHIHCPYPRPHLLSTRVSGAISFLVFGFQFATSPVSHPPKQWNKKPCMLPFA